jgi:hypothetical protein
MKNTHDKIAEIDWQRATGELNQKGICYNATILAQSILRRTDPKI